MRITTNTLGLVSSFAFIHGSTALRGGSWCPVACETTLNYVTFNDTDPWLKHKIRSCRSEHYVTSVYLCFEEYCVKDAAPASWIAERRVWCDEHAGVALPLYRDVIDSWTKEEIAGIRRLEANEALQGLNLSEVTIPDGSFFERAFTTVDTAYYEYAIHLHYGWYMFYFWLIVVSIGISRHLLALMSSLRYQSGHSFVPSGSSSSKASRYLSLSNSWLKRYITIPALFSNRCSQPYGWCTIPPRIQSLTIAAFVLLNIVVCCIDYRLTSGNLYWPEKTDQLLRYVSDRTGIISLVNFPLVWLFGMRNDALMWITGWGFGTYNAFHRWAARVATVQAVIHSVGYTVMIMGSGGWTEFFHYLTKHYFWNGELATIAMCALLAFSVYGLRRAHYEVFLITHIALSIAALWSMYYHVEIFTNGEWNIFIWPCAVIWMFDRCLRGLRTLAFDWKIWNTRAVVTYDEASNLVRVEVPLNRCRFSPRSGTYYYMYVLDDIKYAAQSHPFTLAYVATSDGEDIPLSPVSSRRAPSIASGVSESSSLLSRSSKPPSMTFFVRPYGGFTARLAASCATSPAHPHVLLEGPYGTTLPLRTYPTVLFIAGGTGIAVALSYLCSLLAAGSHTHSVHITWAVRESAFLTAVLQDFAADLADPRCALNVHVTQDSAAKGDVPPGVVVRSGRPDVKGVVERVVDVAGRERVAVVACGPAIMADQARKASVGMLKEASGVDYFEESFKW